jgi:hypothetical protein
MPYPFLTLTQFGAEFGTLTSAQSLTADRLLGVVSEYIRARKPDADEGTAAQVVFEIVRDALNFGPYERLSHFENETSKRREAGTFDYAAKVLDELLTDKHKQMLGIARVAEPLFNFPECDY